VIVAESDAVRLLEAERLGEMLSDMDDDVLNELLVENVYDFDAVWLMDELCDFEGVLVGVLATIDTTNATVSSQRADGHATGGCVQLVLREAALLIKELCCTVTAAKEMRRLVWAGAISEVVRY
jgi:hypothetical protein